MGRLRLLFHLTGGTLSLVLSSTFSLAITLMLGLLFWLQTEGSLEHALRVVGAALPAGQSLQSGGVTGSVKNGGRIDHLVWRKGELVVEGQGLDVTWDWRGLLEGELRVNSLHALSVRVTDRSSTNGSPFSELPLPIRADVQFVVDRFDWSGPPAWQVDALRGHYRFDGTTHSVQDAHVRMADGSYDVRGELQALQPMALTLQVHGDVQAPVKIQQAPLLLEAKANAHGTLLGSEASLDVAVDLQPQGNARSRPLGSMEATLQATLKPSQAQPIVRAQGQWTALNLASLWPQAPQTSLSGQAQVLPDGAGWKGEVQVQNNAPGPLNQQRLPLESAQASLQYRNGQWMLSALQAQGAGGTVQAQGRYEGSPALWSVAGTLQGLQPRQLDTRWPVAALDGKVVATQTPQGIVFDTQLLAPITALDAAQTLRMEAKGIWNEPMLQFESLLLQTPQAQVTGQLQVDTRNYASSGHLRAALPGAHVAIDGSLAATTGQGNSEWQVSDVQTMSRWLQELPLVGAELPALNAQGAVDFSARWSGGWQNLGSDLKLEASAKSQHLDLADSYHLRDLKLDVAGTLRDLALQFKGKTQSGTQQLALAASSQISRLSAGQWQARVDSLDFSAADGQQTKPWTLQLQQPVTLDWQQSALNRSISLAAGTMRLSGPATGTALMQWQSGQWSQAVANGLAIGAPRWSSRGQLQGVPLAWLELLGQTRIANLGLRGDLVFGGQWDAGMEGRGLQLIANVQRTGGDLQLLSADANGNLLHAGLRDARIEVQVNRDALHANLVWASDAGGNAQVDFNTTLSLHDGAWVWASDAPLKATLHANLPRVGAWSLIAPVGWRINGTLDADVQLSGTRSQPKWRGGLLARDMTVRSAVEGIDFSNGLLRLQIEDQHIEIAELTLQGAGGAIGGQLLATGTVDWLPGAVGSPLTSRLRIALDAKAQALRVTTRPDKRLVVSGNLAARLIDTRLVMRGILMADQALFVLPDDNTPKLGSDVVVKRGKPVQGEAASAVDSPQSRAQTLIPDLNIVLDPGPNFQVQGHGLQTRLTGLLTLQAEGRDDPPKLTGELHTASGTYRAYGQSLRIEDGTLRFTGVYDNPTLDILAVRPNLSQVVGVEVSGTAQLPVVRLYSDPDLPDAEKLSWLVLGRSSANGGAEAALLQQAALALLAGRGVAPTEGIGKAFGLDEVSLGQISTTNLDGTTGTEATVRLGKRISRDFYVAYERGLAGTLGTFYVFYDLSRRFTLRGESGTQNAVDLIFTTRYD
jgi:translocation and assembly module TamB